MPRGISKFGTSSSTTDAVTSVANLTSGCAQEPDKAQRRRNGSFAGDNLGHRDHNIAAVEARPPASLWQRQNAREADVDYARKSPMLGAGMVQSQHVHELPIDGTRAPLSTSFGLITSAPRQLRPLAGGWMPSCSQPSRARRERRPAATLDRRCAAGRVDRERGGGMSQLSANRGMVESLRRLCGSPTFASRDNGVVKSSFSRFENHVQTDMPQHYCRT